MEERITELQNRIQDRYSTNHFKQGFGKGNVCLSYGQEDKANCVGYLIKKKKKKDKLVFHSWVGRRSLNQNPIVEKSSFEMFVAKVIERIRKQLKDVYKENTKLLFKEKQKKLFQLEVEAITKEIIDNYSSYKNSSGISIGQNVVVTRSEGQKYFVQMKERMTKEEYVEFLHFYKTFKQRF